VFLCVRSRHSNLLDPLKARTGPGRIPSSARQAGRNRHEYKVHRATVHGLAQPANGPSQKNRAEQDWVILMMALLFLVGIGIVIAICYVIILG
jgi:hypothetical protein